MKVLAIDLKGLKTNLKSLSERYSEEYAQKRLISYIEDTDTSQLLLADRELTVPSDYGDFTFTFGIEDQKTGSVRKIPDTFRFIREEPKVEVPPDIDENAPVSPDPVGRLIDTINSLVDRAERNHEKNLETVIDLSDRFTNKLTESFTWMDEERQRLSKEREQLTEERVENARNAGKMAIDAVQKATENINNVVVERPSWMDKMADKITNETDAKDLLDFAVGAVRAFTGKEVVLNEEPPA